MADTPRTKVSGAPEAAADALPRFEQVRLETGPDGRARFCTESIELGEGQPMARLSPWRSVVGLQLRHSPVGFRSDFHCTTHPQWLFVLSGRMAIGLQDGSWREFGPGEHFVSADTLPAGADFDASVHGHRSRQLGAEPLVTAFVRL